MHRKYAGQWPEGQIVKPKNAKQCKKCANHIFHICLHSWVLQSVPPAIVSHIWDAFVCILVVLQSARPVWGMYLLRLTPLIPPRVVSDGLFAGNVSKTAREDRINVSRKGRPVDDGKAIQNF